MVYTKDNLAAIVACFTEKGWTGTLNPLDYSIWDILQELVYEGGVNRVQFSKIFRMLSETNGIILMIRQREKLFRSGKRCLAAVAKQNGGPIQHIFC